MPNPYLTPPLAWGADAEALHDSLAARGVVDPATGERFTVRRVDDAIQSAVETLRETEGARILDIFTQTWHLLAPGIAGNLELDFDELVEALP